MPVEYVKVCPAFGPGFYYVPGTDSCLKIGGRVRLDYLSGANGTSTARANTRHTDLNTFRARAYFIYDHRTNTEYGLVRTFARVHFTNDNGLIKGAGVNADSGAANVLDRGQNLYIGNGIGLEYAYVQFGGFTFGRASDPYEILYYSNGLIPTGLNGWGVKDNTSENIASYTASLGNGVTATLALKDSNEGSKFASATAAPYQSGNSAPDVIGTVEVAQAWGKAKIAGAAHQIRYPLATPSSEWGFGGSAGVQINLPMIAAGDFIGASVSYSQGAVIYGGGGSMVGGNYSFSPVDAVVNGTTSKLSTTMGLAGGFDHYWTPKVDTNLYAGYVTYENDDAAAGSQKAKQWTVGQYTKWTPITGLQLGIETGYRNLAVTAATAPTTGKAEKSDFFGRLRVQRDF